MIWILGNTVDGAHLDTLRSIVMTDTFRAFVWVNLINFLTLVNCLIRTFGFTNIAVDAFIGYI